MPGLNIFTSNRLEILAEQLSKIIVQPVSSPLYTETIVVQSKGMERWLLMELAKKNGISANCRFPFPNAFLQEIFSKLLPDLPEVSLFEPDIMAFKIMRILPGCLDLPGFESLKNYLEDDKKSLKIFQLSEKIADTFDQYLVFRPEMIFMWEQGKKDNWQAQLWQKLASGNEKIHRARLQKELLEKIKGRQANMETLYERVSVFGISYLPPFHMQILAGLSELTSVNLFIMNPCKEYWADIVSNREIKKIKGQYSKAGLPDNFGNLHLEKGNRLLASMGTMGKNFFSLVSGFDCNIHELFEGQFNDLIDDSPNDSVDDSAGSDMLSCIKSDILNLRNTEWKKKKYTVNQKNDYSIQIHSCHSPMREIEVLHDNLLAMFENDPDLLPEDIIIMIPDIELYAPYIHAGFDAQADDAVRIPYSISDQSIRKESRVINGFLSILELKESRLSATRVLALLESPGIKEKFGLARPDMELVEQWIKDTRIRWGIDMDSRLKMGLPGFKENTWKAGMERLLLGYAMPGYDSKMFAGILPYDNIEGSDVKVLEKFLEFTESLFFCIETLSRPENLTGWSIFLNKILEQFFLSNEETEHEIQIIRNIINGLPDKEKISGFDDKIELELIRSYLEKSIEQTGFGFGFISGGVTFCATLPMRSIPFKIICLIGMNNDAFPGNFRPLGFDIIAKHPVPGDRSKRNDDKYLFLEAIISARKKLYISYVGQSIQDNTPVPPSVIVSELLDTIVKDFDTPETDIMDHIITKHRLQAFSPEYFKKGSKLFSYSEENLIAASSLYDRRNRKDRKDQKGQKKYFPFIATELSTPQKGPEESDERKYIDIDTLCAFFSNPARFLLQNRIGLYLDQKTQVADERENFTLDNLEKYQIGTNFVDKSLSGVDVDNFFSIQKAAGRLPHGNVGELFFNEIRLDANSFVNKTKKYIQDKLFDTVDVDLDFTDFNLKGRLSNIYTKGQLYIRYAKKKAKDILKLWIYHLVLCAANKDKLPENSFLISKDAALKFSFVKNNRSILEYLCFLYREGLKKPLHFFPETSFEYARQRLLKGKHQSDALMDALKKWRGSSYNNNMWKESDDPYYELCFSGTDPLNKEFQQIAEKIYKDIFEHCPNL